MGERYDLNPSKNSRRRGDSGCNRSLRIGKSAGA
jgi:hypothetical protein